MAAADGPGPDYCRDCKKVRRSTEWCEPCPRVALLPENEPAADLFLTCLTQVRHGPDGFPVGLDYAAVEAAARLCAVPEPAAVFRGVMVCEEAWLAVNAERRAALSKEWQPGMKR